MDFFTYLNWFFELKIKKSETQKPDKNDSGEKKDDSRVLERTVPKKTDKRTSRVETVSALSNVTWMVQYFFL